MQTVQQVTGSGVPLLLDDIDTDRIIPARYLRCVTFDGLGEHAFEDDRKQDASHPFDDARFANGSVLVSGRNFGCGSSREHAPQSLNRWGINAVIAESFAEIFFGNCTALGIPAVCLARPELEKLSAAISDDPQLEVTVDLDEKQVRYSDASVACEIPESARVSLVTGEYDFLAQLLDGKSQIEQTAASLPYMTNFAGE
ncbi:MAG: 3-isopropylmalate dehydratase small subunit [Planctomycetaceae bacterium]|jgi:3-isopropylmalate/(R)-2-methylmalate dehydratase small subunit|nr:3-isopropylmalate dehydratase small subunit [Planctomycetaceae bacterium]MBT6155331.1 3-isopropylmalate dehydratase small subunit [Planctomycetaceae bacterium]MBT6485173.1 3-isopropylmalate dehydratase small subunit [Planctomycetaceae bacterium]MBT6497142.1 3-isopropylmalate dehydratase small subunit [Planctomycetaceae bacterium]